MAMPHDADAMREEIRRAANEDLDICAEVEAYIVSKPLKAILFALLAGIVVGKLIL
ncbi:MAG TPA: hypothetical protein VGK90_04100 [Rhizomicrobium sp.]|jgi:hypothetical protein